jgi:hypothetical protein
MEAIALLNIEMIDVSGSIEIHIGNRAPEAGTLSNNRVAGIVIDDLGYIGCATRFIVGPNVTTRATGAPKLFILSAMKIAASAPSECPMIIIGPLFLQTGRLAREFFIVQMPMDGRSEATLNKFLVENIEPCGKMPANPLNR